MALTKVYFNADLGSGTGAGTVGNPYGATVAQLQTEVSAGKHIMLGGTWRAATLALTNRSPTPGTIIESWDRTGSEHAAGIRGTFDCMTYTSSTGWTPIGDASGRFTKAVTCFAGTVPTISSGTHNVALYANKAAGDNGDAALELRLRISAANATTAGDWFATAGANPTITVCTGSDSITPDMLWPTGFALAPSNAGFVYFWNSKRLRFVGMRWVGGSPGLWPDGATGHNSDFIFEDCYFEFGLSNNLSIFTGAPSSSFFNRRVRLVRPTFRSHTRLEANRLIAEFNTDIGTHNALSVVGLNSAILTIDPVFADGYRHASVNWAHSNTSTNSQPQYPTGINLVCGVTSDRAYSVSPDDGAYGRNVNATLDGGWCIDGLDMPRNTSGNQVAGRFRWKNWRFGGSFRTNDGAAADFGGDNAFTAYYSTVTYQYGTYDGTVSNFEIDDPYNYAIVLQGSNAAPQLPQNGLKVKNGIIKDVAHYAEKRRPNALSNVAWVSGTVDFHSTASADVGQLAQFDNVAFVTGGTNIFVRKAAGGTGIANNTSDVVDGTTLSGSVPRTCVRAATLGELGINALDEAPTSGTLYRTGTHGGWSLTRSGQLRWNPPNIGAN